MTIVSEVRKSRVTLESFDVLAVVDCKCGKRVNVSDPDDETECPNCRRRYWISVQVEEADARD